jgi:hypothetical protein
VNLWMGRQVADARFANERDENGRGLLIRTG